MPRRRPKGSLQILDHALAAAADVYVPSLPCAMLLERIVADGYVKDLYYDRATEFLVIAVPDERVAPQILAALHQQCGGADAVALVPDLWREPDKEDAYSAIWYGPGGREGDTATEVRHTGGDEFDVAEYQNVMGMLEDADPEVPFLKTSTSTKAYGYRHAAGLGVAHMQERGGSEEFVDSLP